MAKMLEVLKGSVLLYDKGGAAIWHRAGEVFEAPADHDHLLSGDSPVCKVHVPAPAVASSEPEPTPAEEQPAAPQRYGKK